MRVNRDEAIAALKAGRVCRREDCADARAADAALIEELVAWIEERSHAEDCRRTRYVSRTYHDGTPVLCDCGLAALLAKVKKP
jgi:hypothetical protein